jgi:hypothetical protein
MSSLGDFTQNTNQSNVINPATTPTMALVDCPLANIEYSYVIPANTRKFMLYLMGADDTDVTKYYWAAAAVNYGEIYGKESYFEDNLLLNGKTLYFKVSVAGKKIHVTTWQ